jgi:aspartyl-tRNA(Asn)/glutamyl-tRNA(Gln) amidotransferase subunit A
LLNATLTDLSAALAAKKVSSVELTRHCLERIGRFNRQLNAFIEVVDEALALEAAKRADARRAGKGNAGEAQPLTGIPIAHKDIFCTRGLRTTCGSRMLENYVSPYDAHVVEQLERAGTVLVGKCNMDEFAMGSSTESSHFGPVRNPWDGRLVPGGSSGGSAAAVAARLVPAATGTDTGGSIRQPAALSGVCGLKPTYGVVSRYGMVAFASSLDQAGPLAKSAADLALMMNAMAGFDERDSTSLERPKEDYGRLLGMDLKGLRIGVPKEYFGEGVDAGVLRAVEAAVRWFESQGARRVELELPNSPLGVPVYYVIAPAEASSNLSRFDGVRYGHRAEGYSDLMDMYCRTRAEGFGAEVKQRILVGTYVLSHGYYDAYYLQAQRVRRLIARDFTQAFERCDVILGPTSPTTAFPIGATKASDPVQMYLNDIFTVSAPLAGVPALSIPCGFDDAGLPVGLQLTGSYFSEARLLGAAHRYQQATDWHLRVPRETPL